MDLRLNDAVKLNDGNEYVIVSIAEYNNQNYYYLVDINNNENLKFFTKEENAMFEVEDGNIIQTILPLLIDTVKPIIEAIE